MRSRYKCVTEQNFTIPKIVHILLLQVGNDDFALCRKVQAESLIIYRVIELKTSCLSFASYKNFEGFSKGKKMMLA